MQKENDNGAPHFKSSFYDDRPFSLTFSNGSKSITIILENADDIFKIASAYQMMLLEHGIPFKTIKDEQDSN